MRPLLSKHAVVLKALLSAGTGCDRTDDHHHHEAQTGGTYAEGGPAWSCPTPWATGAPCPGPKVSSESHACACYPSSACRRPPNSGWDDLEQRWIPNEPSQALSDERLRKLAQDYMVGPNGLIFARAVLSLAARNG